MLICCELPLPKSFLALCHIVCLVVSAAGTALALDACMQNRTRWRLGRVQPRSNLCQVAYFVMTPYTPNQPTNHAIRPSANQLIVFANAAKSLVLGAAALSGGTHTTYMNSHTHSHAPAHTAHHHSECRKAIILANTYTHAPRTTHSPRPHTQSHNAPSWQTPLRPPSCWQLPCWQQRLHAAPLPHRRSPHPHPRL